MKQYTLFIFQLLYMQCKETSLMQNGENQKLSASKRLSCYLEKYVVSCEVLKS